jgi:uncharacterized protein YecE (DUF72 family)
MSVHFGTCSWKYKDWQGIIYPDEGKYNFLQEYAKHLDTVEVDQWFWSLFGKDKIKLPESKTVTEYLLSVPEEFKFTIKIPNSITLTHFYTHGRGRGAPMEENPFFLSVDLMNRFLESIEPLETQTATLMFQFEYLNKKKMASQGEFLRQFNEFVEQLPKDWKYAVECRNPNYLNEKYFSFLNQHNLAHVFVHGYYMPHIKEVYDKYADFIRDLAVIRLMGSDRKGIEERAGNKWHQIVDNRDDELPDIVQMVQELEAKAVMVFMNINNHYEGSAPLTIKKLQKMLDNAKV